MDDQVRELAELLKAHTFGCTSCCVGCWCRAPEATPDDDSDPTLPYSQHVAKLLIASGYQKRPPTVPLVADFDGQRFVVGTADLLADGKVYAMITDPDWARKLGLTRSHPADGSVL